MIDMLILLIIAVALSIIQYRLERGSRK